VSFGLQARDIESITKVAGEIPEIKEVILFGSRAKGNFKKGSDIDLAIKGQGITEVTIKRLSARLNEEAPLPYFVDVLHYEKISNLDLVDHIDRVGVVIYSQKQ
jgi:predicted nucleotidyltransferase